MSGLMTLALLAQAVWHVDVQGTPPGNGTLSAPYTSIQFALDQASTINGDTVSVAPGEYVENIILPDKFVRLVSKDGPVTTRIAPASQGDLITAATDWNSAVEGFTLTGAHGGGAALHVIELGSMATVRRCILTDSDVGIWSEYDLFVESCTIAGNQLASRQSGIGIPRIDVKDTIFWDNPDGFELDSFWFTEHCVGALPFASSASDILSDPEFWNSSAADYHLRANSPAIDAGDPALQDPDGSALDVGALPYDSNYAPAPYVYCTPKLGSDGCLAKISFQGATPTSTPSASSPEPFLVMAQDVSVNKTGLFYFGLASSPFPFQGGWFCAQPPTARTGLQNSGSTGSACSGAFALDVNAMIQSGRFPFLSPGVEIYGQFWFRDPTDPFQSIRTNAVCFVIAD